MRTTSGATRREDVHPYTIMCALPSEPDSANLWASVGKLVFATLTVAASENEETLSTVDAVEQKVRSALQATPPHTTPRPFPRTCGPTAPPRSPPSASHSSLPLSCEDATMLLVWLVQKTEKASRAGAFSSRDPAVTIFLKPR